MSDPTESHSAFGLPTVSVLGVPGPTKSVDARPRSVMPGRDVSPSDHIARPTCPLMPALGRLWFGRMMLPPIPYDWRHGARHHPLRFNLDGSNPLLIQS